MILGTWLSYLSGYNSEDQEQLPITKEKLNEYYNVNCSGEGIVVNSSIVEAQKVGNKRINKKKKKRPVNMVKLLLEGNNVSKKNNRIEHNEEEKLSGQKENNNGMNNKRMRKMGQIKRCSGSVQTYPKITAN